MSRVVSALATAAASAAAILFASHVTGGSVHAQPPAAAADPVARLAGRIERGETTLEYRAGAGYLPSLLERLGIAIDSQILVFSKTSFQQAIISPKNPRAIYFNDTAAVGTVPGGRVYELAAVDPIRGVSFYTLDVGEPVRFERQAGQCVFCHLPGNRGSPGFVVASVIPDRDGVPFFTGTLFQLVDHRTPLEDRWGGWYVTGRHGSAPHMGNAVAPDPEHPADLDQSASLNVTDLGTRFDTSKYLAPTSDIVALMTLEHQAGAYSRLFGARVLYDRAQQSGMPAALARDLDAAIDDLVAYLVFADEAPLAAPVSGVSTFARSFAARGPRDRQGRSLCDFDLQTRLFKYPLSFTIYEDAFDRLQPGLRDRVYRRLRAVLSGDDTRGAFAGLDADRRAAALEILRDTKAALPSTW